jgi:hypothetical protein
MALPSFTRAEKNRLSLGDYTTELQELGRLTPVVQEALGKVAVAQETYDTIFYLAGALTGVPEETKENYAKLSDHIAGRDGMFGYAPHLHGTDPVKHPSVTAGEVRDIDYAWAVVAADYHINSLAPVAAGPGIEEGWAEAAGIPTVYLAPEDFRASRIVLGMHNVVGEIRYNDFEQDALPQLDQFLDTLPQVQQ